MFYCVAKFKSISILFESAVVRLERGEQFYGLLWFCRRIMDLMFKN